MNTSNTSPRSRTQQPVSRIARAVPVSQLCEIACLVLCRVVMPKLARGGFDAVS